MKQCLTEIFPLGVRMALCVSAFFFGMPYVYQFSCPHAKREEEKALKIVEDCRPTFKVQGNSFHRDETHDTPQLR